MTATTNGHVDRAVESEPTQETGSSTNPGSGAPAPTPNAEDSYRVLFECNPLPMWVYDLESLRFLAVNESAVRHYGFSKEEFLGMTLKDIRPPEDIGAMLATVAGRVSDFSESGVWRHRKKDGSVIHVEIVSHALQFDGRPARLVSAHDVTGRMQAEAALLERNRYIESILENAPIGFAINTIDDGKARFISRKFEQIYGVSPGAVADVESYFEAVYPEPSVREAMRARILLDMASGDPARMCWEDVPITTRDGQKKYVTAVNIPLTDQNLMVSTVQDVTVRYLAQQSLHESEEALRLSEQRNRAILNAVPDLLFRINRQGIILEYRAPADAALYADPKDFLGKSLRELLPPEVARPAMDAVSKVLDISGAETFEYELLVSGKVRSYENRFVALSADEVLSVIRDITERKRTEEALRESEERFRTTLYSIGDGVITTDTQANILQMNPVAEQLTGWTENEARGRHVDEVFRIVHERSGEPVVNPVDRVLSDGSIVGLTHQTVLVSRDGTRRPIADSAAPIRDSRGETTGVVLVFNDQTERRGLESQLLHAQKMEAVGRLAGGVAHDFNNMIGVILGYATIMEQSLGPLDPLLRNVQPIVAAAQRSANLTRQLLAFARRQVVAPVPLNLNASLSSLHRMLTRLVGEDIALTVVQGAQLWNVKIDPTQIDQILANLATNARDAIDNIGTIRIETANVSFDAAFARRHPEFIPGDYVLLAFSDTGKGMDRATQAHIFDPFFTTKPEGQGTGLGLATVFGIVKQNNGFIDVYSEPGEGTTLEIYLPRCLGEAESPVERPETQPLSGNETILIVEDEEQLLGLVRSALEMYGYTVLTARSPGEALGVCESTATRIDLVITDVVMPGMNGKELKGRLDSVRPGMKTIFMSGYTADVVAHRGILDEGIYFLQKPFTPLALARKVREVIDSP